uniref:Uncharacterized protein n=1 Tax=Marseillevirus LCMAC101 TaxID=2506602 RepID=A0A481YR83_9VIRU|nr:MAG: hypothetical protein LCMAC101_00040 [Marseillevirus LCMAC101]
MSPHVLATALLPHAHKKYAGQVQKTVLNALKPFTSKSSMILYIPACHQQCLDSKGENDHSILYLYDRLSNRFGKKLYIMRPIPYSQKTTKQTIQEIKNLTGNIVIIGTVDLSHHEFQNKSWPRIHKMRAEEQTILGLCQLNPSLFDSKFIDAPWSVKIVQHFAPAHGVVVAYDDSATVSSTVPAHDATQKTLDSFVSYVGIVFAKENIPRAEKLRDQLLLASVKNTIFHSFHRTGLTDQTQAPLWLIPAKEGGVWAGLTCNKRTKCSLGHTEVTSGTRHTKALRDSASRCLNDADRRWGGVKSLKNCTFKYERLTRTKPVAWKNRKREYNPDTTGIILNLKNGQTATYLPGVWREHWPNKGIDYVLGELADKAQKGKSLQDIDKQKLYKYTTKVFKTK